MNILIVDDSALIRGILARVLSPIGTAIAPATLAGAREVLGFHSGHSDIDVVLLDLEMPECDGLSFLREMRAHEHLADLSVIMVTASQEAERLNDAFSAGANDYITKPAHSAVLRARTRNAARLTQALRAAKKREHDLALLNERLEQLSLTDALTGVANRRAFDHQLEQALAFSRRSGLHSTLVMVDIDHFKRFNDALGHPAGDACLQNVARTLHQACRRTTDLVARYGGEEFALLLLDTAEEGGLKVADTIHALLLEANLTHPDHPLGRITVSVGVATMNGSSDVIEAADQALYQAKMQGRNRTVLAADTATPCPDPTP